MIQVSTEVANALNQNSRQFDAKIYVNGSAVNCEIMSLKLHKGACGKFTVGSIFIPYVELTVNGTTELTANTEFELKIAVKLSSGWSTYYRVGYFTPTSITDSHTQTEIYAQGRISKTNQRLFVLEPVNRTLQGILTAIRNKGFSVILKGLTIPNASIDPLIPLSGLTVRDGIALLVACSGGYGTEDADGNIVLAKFQHSEPILINPDAMAEYPAVKGNYRLTGITVEVNDSLKYEIPTSEAEKNFEIKNPYFNSQMVSTFTSNTIGYSFAVTDIPIALGDFRYEPWDSVTFAEGELFPSNILYPRADLYPGMKVSEESIPCLTIDFAFDGGLKTSIKAEGDLPAVVDTKTAGPLSAQLQEAYDRATAARNRAEQAQQRADEAYEKAEEEGDSTYTKVMWRHGTSTRGVGAWSDEIPALTSTYPYLWSCIATVTRDVATGQETYVYGEESKSTMLNGVYAFVSGAADGSTVINGGCLYGGTIVLGGSGNQNGTLEVRTSTGSLTTRLDNSGLYSIAGTIGGYTINSSGFRYSDTSEGVEIYPAHYKSWHGSFTTTIDYSTISLTNGRAQIELNSNTGISMTYDLSCRNIDNTGYIDCGGNINATYLIAYSGIQKETTPANGGNIACYWYYTGAAYALRTDGSARRWKHDIEDVKDFDVNELYNLHPRQFRWNEDQELGDDLHVGFIADEVGEFFPPACCYSEDESGEMFECGWDVKPIVAGMLRLLQNQHEEIEELKRILAEK